MKRLIAATAALSLLAVTAAHADDQHPKGGGQPHGSPSGGSHTGGAPHGNAPSSPPPHTGPVPYVPQGRNDVPHPTGGPTVTTQSSTHLGHTFGAPGFTSASTDRPKYDPQHFPRQITANKHFSWHGGAAWQPQPGFYYRRWGYGQYLPAGWFISQFWINDFADYDLPVPPYGYEWVRSGPDALLVDTYSGEVVEAVYGVFV